jgi:hypothetical protein
MADPSGLFSCNREGNSNVTEACGDLNDAMQRGNQRVPIVANFDNATSDGIVQLKELVD